MVCLPCSKHEDKDITLERRHCERHANSLRHRQALATASHRSGDSIRIGIDNHLMDFGRSEDADSISYWDDDHPAPLSDLWEPVPSTFPVTVENSQFSGFGPHDFDVTPWDDRNEMAMEDDSLFEDDPPINQDLAILIQGQFCKLLVVKFTLTLGLQMHLPNPARHSITQVQIFLPIH